jgi:hypothetical protein
MKMSDQFHVPRAWNMKLTRLRLETALSFTPMAPYIQVDAYVQGQLHPYLFIFVKIFIEILQYWNCETFLYLKL